MEATQKKKKGKKERKDFTNGKMKNMVLNIFRETMRSGKKVQKELERAKGVINEQSVRYLYFGDVPEENNEEKIEPLNVPKIIKQKFQESRNETDNEVPKTFFSAFPTLF